MKEIIRLYGDKEGLEEKIREIKPEVDSFLTFSKCLDTSVLFEDISQDDFLDICDALDDRIYNDKDVSLEETLVNFLSANDLKIATAESCTGGLIAASIVNVSGASKVFYEGLVTYSNEAKMSRLGVSEDTLFEFGAVSPQTAKEMAYGLLCDEVDVAVSTTGIAGPLGGTLEKPVGLVYIGIAFRDRPTESYRYVFDGGREQIRQSAKNTALYLTWKYLKDNL